MCVVEEVVCVSGSTELTVVQTRRQVSVVIDKIIERESAEDRTAGLGVSYLKGCTDDEVSGQSFSTGPVQFG